MKIETIKYLKNLQIDYAKYEKSLNNINQMIKNSKEAVKTYEFYLALEAQQKIENINIELVIEEV